MSMWMPRSKVDFVKVGPAYFFSFGLWHFVIIFWLLGTLRYGDYGLRTTGGKKIRTGQDTCAFAFHRRKLTTVRNLQFFRSVIKVSTESWKMYEIRKFNVRILTEVFLLSNT